MKKIIYFFLFFIFISLQIFPQAKFEPDNGCYAGAFIMNDSNINGNVERFEQLTGKDHSMYFSYTAYGQPFPADWVKYYSSQGAVVQIAFEPNNGLNEVVDGDYIRNWAREARRSGAMILLRWASEMNGNWVAWNGDPQIYIEKFKLIHDIMKEEAPNVAMVWAPNDIPNDPNVPKFSIPAYYPGDDYVDWVGIDFYGVYYYENGTPERTDPREKLKVVYDVYSSKKPIIICEWAATHYTERVNPPETTTDYAIAQMDSLYLNLQNQFPKLKALCWFDMNTLSTNGNNFTLTDDQQVLNNYKLIMRNSYFRSTPYRNVPDVKLSIAPDTAIRNNIQFDVQTECDVPLDSAVLFMNGKRISSSNQPFQFIVNAANFEDGIYNLKVVVYASSGFNNFEEIPVVIDKGGKYINAVYDDSSSHLKFNGSWFISTSQPDKFGDYYHYSNPGDGSGTAIWNQVAANPGFYNVYAWWSEHQNRATNAPYVIFHAGNYDTVKVDQQRNGGRWNLLGTYYFGANLNETVSLNNNADGIVIADAVRIEWAFTTDIKNEKQNLISDYSLSQNYPNPFNPSTKIRFQIPKESYVTLKIYDILGNEIETLVNEEKPAGFYEVQFSAAGKNRHLASGIYFYQLRSNDFVETKKFILMK